MMQSIRRRALPAWLLACVSAMSLSCAADSAEPESGIPEGDVAETQQAWAVDDVNNEGDNTHLWIAATALRMIRDNRAPAAGTPARALLDDLLNPTSVCGSKMRQGIYDADYLPAYNNGVPTDTNTCWMGFNAYVSNGWVNHFYDPDSQRNYAGNLSPTARTEANDHWARSKNGNPASYCYELGLALHYMTDATQPMHAANFTNASSDALLLHENFEQFAQRYLQSVTQPAWVDIGTDITPSELVHAAAANAKPRSAQIVQATSPCSSFMVAPPSGGCPYVPVPGYYDRGEICWAQYGAMSTMLGHVNAALTSAAQYTANYLKKWLDMAHGADHTVTAGSNAASSPTWTRSCGSNEVVVGLYGRKTGWMLTQIGLQCAVRQPDGTMSAPYATGTVGSADPAGATMYDWGATCPSGQAVSNIKLGYPDGSVGVGGISFACTNPDNPSQTWQSQYWGTSNGLSEAACLAGEAFKGEIVVGGGSGVINRLTGTCGVPSSVMPRSRFVGQLVSLRSNTFGTALGVTPQGGFYGASAGDPEARWQVDEGPNGTVYLVGSNKLQLGSRSDGSVYLTGNRLEWERWLLDEGPNGEIVITSAQHGLHLSAQQDGTAKTTSNNLTWEKWTLPRSKLVGTSVSLVSTFGTRVLAKSAGGVTHKNVEPYNASTWTLADAGDGTYFLVNGGWLLLGSNDQGGVFMTEYPLEWERWMITPAPGGTFTITSVQFGRRLSAQAGGGLTTTTAATSAEQWTLPGNYDIDMQSVFGPNLALGKPTSQSSTGPWSTAGSGSAVDGNTNGDFQAGSVTHTNNDSNAWWQVDLQSSQPISTIVLWNRTDCCSDRLSNFTVMLSNDQSNWESHSFTGAAPRRLALAANRSARYVRVRLDGQNYLSLAEVQVFGQKNFALGKPTEQSSTYSGSLASAASSSAVDGNTNGNFQAGSVTSTNSEWAAWWKVDLGSMRYIKNVAVWNRTDCCAERLNDFDVVVGDDNNDPSTWQVFSQSGPAGTVTSFTIDRPLRYVVVRLRGTNYLSLAEVQVFE
ncbi:fibronectin type III domain protein [Minicystis rosea]|nr:fibronectin type III domain protein [Minicystis rosea]